MTNACLAYIKHRDGHSEIAYVKLAGNLPFSIEEMERWIKESDEQIVKVTCRKLPAGINVEALLKYVGDDECIMTKEVHDEDNY